MRPEEVRAVCRARPIFARRTFAGQQVQGYREEEKVDLAIRRRKRFSPPKLFVDNFRWAGVPFYVRTGKRLPVKATEVVIEFKNMPENIHFARKNQLGRTCLSFRVQPIEGVYFEIQCEKAGQRNGRSCPWRWIFAKADRSASIRRKRMSACCMERFAAIPRISRAGTKWHWRGNSLTKFKQAWRRNGQRNCNFMPAGYLGTGRGGSS